VRSRSAGTRVSSRALRSWSQKNFASERRARSTRSLPATMFAAPEASVAMLATTTKRGAVAPDASTSVK